MRNKNREREGEREREREERDKEDIKRERECKFVCVYVYFDSFFVDNQIHFVYDDNWCKKVIWLTRTSLNAPGQTELIEQSIKFGINTTKLFSL